MSISLDGLVGTGCRQSSKRRQLRAAVTLKIHRPAEMPTETGRPACKTFDYDPRL